MFYFLKFRIALDFETVLHLFTHTLHGRNIKIKLNFFRTLLKIQV